MTRIYNNGGDKKQTNLNCDEVEPTLSGQCPGNHCLTAAGWSVEKDTFWRTDAKLGEHLDIQGGTPKLK